MPELQTQAPEGAKFEYDEVKTQRGQSSLGEVPILVWENVDKAREFYGDEAIADVLNGTSLRVSFQSIARRQKIAGKTDDDIAKAMVEFRPGKRVGGVSTPVSRARTQAAAAAEKLGDQSSLLNEILAKVAAGTITAEELAMLNG